MIFILHWFVLIGPLIDCTIMVVVKNCFHAVPGMNGRRNRSTGWGRSVSLPWTSLTPQPSSQALNLNGHPVFGSQAFLPLGQAFPQPVRVSQQSASYDAMVSNGPAQDSRLGATHALLWGDAKFRTVVVCISTDSARSLSVASVDVALSSPAAVGIETASDHALGIDVSHVQPD